MRIARPWKILFAVRLVVVCKSSPASKCISVYMVGKTGVFQFLLTLYIVACGRRMSSKREKQAGAFSGMHLYAAARGV